MMNAINLMDVIRVDAIGYFLVEECSCSMVECYCSYGVGIIVLLLFNWAAI